MGFLVYDDTREVAMEDRTLAHLQIVMIDKLRRNEKFAVNLRSDRALVSIWVSTCTPMMFVYEGNRHPAINHAWVELLAGEAGLTGVLEILPEPLVEKLPLGPLHETAGKLAAKA
jgi:hypothetical protein